MFILSQGQFFPLVSCFATEEVHKRKQGGTITRTGDPMVKEIFHTIEHHAQDLNWGEFKYQKNEKGGQCGFRKRVLSSVSTRRAVALCIFFKAFFLIPPLFSFFVLEIDYSSQEF